jgi:centromere protein C
MRTNSKSPAKQNPHVGHSSSPMRGSIVAPDDAEGNARGESVKRRLNFSMDKRPALQPVNGDGNAGAGRTRGVSQLTKGHRSGALDLDEDEDDEEDEEVLLRGQVNGEAAVAEESMNLLYGDDGDDVEAFAPNGMADVAEEDDDDDEPVMSSATRRMGQASKSHGAKGDKTARSARIDQEEDDSAPATLKQGRPAASRTMNQRAATNGAQTRKRRSLRSSTGNEDNEDDEADQRQAKKARMEPKSRGRKPGRRAPAADSDEEDARPTRPAHVRVAKGRSKGKRKVSGVGDTSVIIPRGPPLPKGPGLVISRREIPGDSNIHQTRSGRHSYKPIAFWKNEQVTWDQDETMEDVFAARTRDKSSRFLLPGIKEIHRVEDQQPEHKKKRRAGAAGRRVAYAGRAPPQFEDGLLIEDEEPADAWEDEVGRVMGQVAIWKPSFEHSPPAPGADVEVEEEQIAVSGAAIQTREIKDADFRFAKTLSLPFFGCGLVDMPPGSVKKQKNSRKMFMTFFVYTGRVMVTINETSFRISKGGMWFVPRG